MKTCVINVISLEPYSSEQLIVVSGYSCDEMLEWYKKEVGDPKSNKLSEIKKFLKEKEEFLNFISDNRGDIDGLDKGGDSVGQGVYIYRQPPGRSYKLRLLILRYGFSPYKPHNMRTLAHEMLHVCQEFLPQFLDRDEEMEAEAYFHSYLMESCYKSFL
jgi:hypothetical protein